MIGEMRESGKNEGFDDFLVEIRKSEDFIGCSKGQKEVKERGLDSKVFDWVIGRVEKKT